MNMSDFLQNFHFLRPEMLLGFLLLPLIWWLVRAPQLGHNDWAKTIDPRLLSHLTPEAQTPQGKTWRSGILFAWLLLCLALAGPSWEKKPHPVVKINDNLVIALDLSISMLATDIAPNRLTRAKQKLQDLLKLRKEGATALVAFSGDSHVVTPLTDDMRTIQANLPALDPFIMPVIGSRPDLAVEQSLRLLEQAEAPRGRILMITDSIDAEQAEDIEDLLDGKAVSLNILAIGTAEGGPIDLPERGYLKHEGNVVIPRIDFSQLENIANTNDGVLAQLSLDDSDLKRLDVSGQRFVAREQSETAEQFEQGFDAWEDRGYWLLVLIIPLVLLVHRQGVLVILVLAFLPLDQSHAFGWDDLWKTPDQQAAEALQKGETERAAELFESTEHKAHARYNAGQYQQAEQSYSQVDSASAMYNRGNALAQQQKFEEAIAAYDEALERQPDLEDARYNKELIEKFLEQQSQQQQDQQNQQQNGESGQNDESREDSQNSQQDSNAQSDNQSSDSQSEQNRSQQDSGQNKEDSEQEQQNQQDAESEQGDENEASQDRESPSNADEAQQEESDAEGENEVDGAQAVESLSDEEKQSFEQWMRRVPDDPGGLLRRKFEQQARQRNRRSPEEGEPLW